jgi:hypothetical protein
MGQYVWPLPLAPRESLERMVRESPEPQLIASFSSLDTSVARSKKSRPTTENHVIQKCQMPPTEVIATDRGHHSSYQSQAHNEFSNVLNKTQPI